MSALWIWAEFRFLAVIWDAHCHRKAAQWMSYLQRMSVRHPLPYWTGNTPLVGLDHLPAPCRRPLVNNPWSMRSTRSCPVEHSVLLIACCLVNLAVLKISLFIASILPDFNTNQLQLQNNPNGCRKWCFHAKGWKTFEYTVISTVKKLFIFLVFMIICFQLNINYSKNIFFCVFCHCFFWGGGYMLEYV